MVASIIGLLMMLVLSDWYVSMVTIGFMVVYMSVYMYSPIMNSISESLWSFDFLNVSLVMLTLWLTVLILASSSYKLHLKIKPTLFLQCLLILVVILLTAFSVNSLMKFYVAFEAALIPTLLIVVMWGAQPERMKAGMYLMLYTVGASLPLLVMILKMEVSCGTSYMFMFYNYKLTFVSICCLLMAFLVKVPLYGVHYWLPKAHVEAPVGGSMVLAGVLLKLGPYGVLRMLSMLPSLSIKSEFFMVISLMGSLVAAVTCLRQSDMKMLVAYSSVSHMSLMMASIFTMTTAGWVGAKIMLIAHGLTSSGLFALVNFYYENTRSRSLLINKGMIHLVPGLTFFWFLLILGNMAVPPTLNLVGELLMFMSLVPLLEEISFLLVMYSLITMVYSLVLYLNLHHGPPGPSVAYIEALPLYYTVSLGHSAPLYSLFLVSSLFV